MRMYLIRHADPDYPNKTITTQGHLEAEALSQRLEGQGIGRIFSSPMGRAMHTAEYTAKRLGLDIAVRPWMAELGDLRMPVPGGGGDTMMAWDTAGHVLRDGQPLDAMGLHPHVAAPVFAEEIARVGRDSDRFLSELGFERYGGVYRVMRENREQIAVFCHGGLGVTWLAHLLGVPVCALWAGLWLAPSSVTTILFEERVPEVATPRCLCIGDTSHLFAAGLAAQPRGIKVDHD